VTELADIGNKKVYTTTKPAAAAARNPAAVAVPTKAAVVATEEDFSSLDATTPASKVQSSGQFTALLHSQGREMVMLDFSSGSVFSTWQLLSSPLQSMEVYSWHLDEHVTVPGPLNSCTARADGTTARASSKIATAVATTRKWLLRNSMVVV